MCTSLAERSFCSTGSLAGSNTVADFCGAESCATAQTLPDDILLEIFKYHRLTFLRSGPWKWYRLAQVCRRWRFVIFTYPRLLHLCIFVSTNTNPIREIPDFWPVDLPVILWYRSLLSVEDEENIFDMLKNPGRICEMDIDMTCFLLEKCASLLEESFPALEYLRLGSQRTASCSRGLRGALLFPDNFLVNSAPRLRVVHLQNTVFPTLLRLLSTSKRLVSLQLEHIPAERIFTAQDLAVGLSATPQLEFLKIGIHGALVHRSSRENELAPRTVLPALLQLQYMGGSSYLDDFASRINTPNIEQIEATFAGDFDVYNTHELCGLFARVEELESSRRHTTHIRFFEESVVFEHQFTRSTTSSPVSFRVRLADPDWLHSNIVFVRQICLGFQSVGIMHKVTQVEIERFSAPSSRDREVDIDSWLSLFHALSSVKRLLVVGTLVSIVISALVQVSGDATVEKILPALRDLHLPDEPGTSADIEPFVTARKSYGLPVLVHYKGLDWRVG